MIYQIIDIQLMAVFIPVVVDAAGLSDDDVSNYAVDLCERQCLVICDLASFAFKYESCSEPLLFKRILVLADL